MPVQATLTNPSVRLLLPPVLRKQMEKLYQQQMWLWGQDIRSDQGNLLKAYGFDYVSGQTSAGAAGAKGHHSSLYTYTCAGDRGPFTLSLLSFGMGLSYQQLHLFTERYRLRWQCLTQPLSADFSQLKNLPDAYRLINGDARTKEVALQAMLLCARVIRDYEQWIVRTQGKAWRELALKRRPERSHTEAHLMAAAWDELAFALR